VNTGGRLFLAWYYHLPAVAGDDEVDEVWRTSLEPLLRTHTELAIPANVALTGALLARLAEVIPDAVRTLRTAVESGMCHALGTTAYEILPALLPPSHVRRHLERDLALKVEFLGVTPHVFYPGNFTWTPLIAADLVALGYGAIVLDPRHLQAASRTQSWRWLSSEAETMETVMLDTALLDEEVSQLYRYSVEAGALTVTFRSWPCVRRWTFGNTGLLHHPWDTSLEQELARLRQDTASAVLLTLADDGDRVNPVSLANYRRLLERCGDLMLPASALIALGEGADARPLAYLPTFVLGNMDRFWLVDADARYYATLLAQLCAREVAGQVAIDDLLALEDVFPLFWKNVARKRWYFDQATKLLARPTVSSAR
jgi:hypothetical protein